ncbi:MAG TPA: ATP synthase F0 subunit B [bacterium]|nr:ATP synthase F0 subunit B [bacterium]
MVELNFTIVIQAISFVILFLVMKKVFWKPLMKHLDRRDALISGRKDEIEKLRAESIRMREEYSGRIRAARKEGISLQEKLIREGRAERLRLISESLDKAEEVTAAGEKGLLNDKQAALDGIKDEEIGIMAEQIASRILSVQES